MEYKSIPQTHPSLGLFGIIRDSIKTTNKNKNQLIPILLYVFLSLSLLEVIQHNIQAYLEKDYVFHLAEHPHFLQDFWHKFDLITYRGACDDIFAIILVKYFTRVFSFIPTLLVFSVTTISSTYEAYTTNVLEPTKWYLNVRNWYKEPLVTSFCMFLISLSIIGLYAITYGIIIILVVDSWSFYLFVAITLSLPICYFYIGTLWILSLIVSVIEEDCGGFKAIGRAIELMNGKRLQALMIMVPFVIASVCVYRLVYGLTSYDLDLNRATRMIIGVSFINGSDCFLDLFMFVVYTVFYHELRSSLEKKRLKGICIPIISTGDA